MSYPFNNPKTQGLTKSGRFSAPLTLFFFSLTIMFALYAILIYTLIAINLKGYNTPRSFFEKSIMELLIGIFLGIPAYTSNLLVGALKLRNGRVAAATTFFGAIAGVMLAGIVLYTIDPAFKSIISFFMPTPVAKPLNPINVMIGRVLMLVPVLGHAIFMATVADARARQLFSSKSGCWLRQCKLKKQFILIPHTCPFDTITVDDVLDAEIVRRAPGTCRMTLYLDCIPEGDHFLKIIILSKKRTFFSLRLITEKQKGKLLPVTWEQVELLKRKFRPIYHLRCRRATSTVRDA